MSFVGGNNQPTISALSVTIKSYLSFDTPGVIISASHRPGSYHFATRLWDPCILEHRVSRKLLPLLVLRPSHPVAIGLPQVLIIFVRTPRYLIQLPLLVIATNSHCSLRFRDTVDETEAHMHPLEARGSNISAWTNSLGILLLLLLLPLVTNRGRGLANLGLLRYVQGSWIYSTKIAPVLFMP